LAVTTSSRAAVVPDLPTVADFVPGYEASAWYGIVGPKGTPAEIVAKLNGAVVDALADPAVRQRLTELGHVIATREEQTPQALGAFHKAEIETWWPIIKAANIKPE